MADNKDSIAVVIHTYNEEKNIADCLDSAFLLTENIVLIDMESTDKTTEIARSKNARTFTFPHSHYVEPSREFGIKQAQADWVFILDADERLTENLATEIKRAIKSSEFTSYKLPRKNIFGGKKWLKHGGWWPDMQLRLIKTASFRKWPKEIHSTPIIEGEEGMLNNPILHHFHGDLETMVQKTIVFEGIESDLLYKAGKATSTRNIMRKFLGELYRRLFRDRGFLDGKIGIIESIYQAFSKTITYLYLYEKRESRTL